MSHVPTQRRSSERQTPNADAQAARLAALSQRRAIQQSAQQSGQQSGRSTGKRRSPARGAKIVTTGLSTTAMLGLIATFGLADRAASATPSVQTGADTITDPALADFEGEVVIAQPLEAPAATAPPTVPQPVPPTVPPVIDSGVAQTAAPATTVPPPTTIELAVPAPVQPKAAPTSSKKKSTSSKKKSTSSNGNSSSGNSNSKSSGS